MFGNASDTDDDDVGRQVAAVGEVDPGDPVGAARTAKCAMLTGQPGNADATDQPRSVRRVRLGDDGAEPRTELGLQRCRRRLDHGDVHAQLCRAVDATSAPMKPAPMTTSWAPGRRSARSAIASSMVRMTWTPAIASQPGQRRARDAGGDHEAVGVHVGSVGEFHCAAGGVEFRGSRRRAATRPADRRRRLRAPDPPRSCRRRGTLSTAAGGRRAVGSHRRRRSRDPSKPCARSARAAERPASDAPMIATCFTAAPARGARGCPAEGWASRRSARRGSCRRRRRPRACGPAAWQEARRRRRCAD